MFPLTSLLPLGLLLAPCGENPVPPVAGSVHASPPAHAAVYEAVHELLPAKVRIGDTIPTTCNTWVSSTYHPYLLPLSHSSKLPESLAPLLLVVLFGPHSGT